MIYYKFNLCSDAKLEDVIMHKLVHALFEAEKGNFNELKEIHFSSETPVIRVAGWYFCFPDLLRKFWVKTRDYGILEIYSLNKTDIRKNYSHVIKIIEGDQ